MSILYFPAFDFNGEPNGGTLRSKQIYNFLIKSNGVKNICVGEINFKKEILLHPFSIFLHFFHLLFRTKGLVFKNKIKYTICYVYILKLDVDKLSFDSIVLEQGANYTIFIGDILCHLSVEFSLYPHNIEFCVSNQNLSDDAQCYLFIKRSMLSAKNIVVISEFDAQISRVFNDNVSLLEYCSSEKFKPVKTSNEYQNEYGQYFVAFGSFYNPPTLKSMLKLIENFDKLNFVENQKLCISGFGSDDYVHLSTDKVKVIGSLKDEHLDNIILDSIGIIVYQTPTTGWLTKIERLLAYGKPIYINRTYIQAGERYPEMIIPYDL
ncbi:hypothetical protein EKG38_24140 [Shewanella canadensis]|uniref:Glycosyltransferase family 1 protein n=1 Tax=Shewanella canadensis TaxID=271096 RepID=A0A3S0IK31_9GAMM|nr:hypothetical protein [Shewanella canadensis]RTR35966.1 hypothetical protein EKG38_24140 [Shewanella canadensis]